MATITGTSGDDTLSGIQNESDVIYGLGGNDTLYADNDPYNPDTLIGGDGDDVLVADHLSGSSVLSPVLDGGAGIDTLRINDYSNYLSTEFHSIERISFAPAANRTVAYFRSSQFADGQIAPDVTFVGDHPPAANSGTGFWILMDSTVADFSNIRFENWGSRDQLDIFGTNDADEIIGSQAGDYLVGFGGDDIIHWGATTSISSFGDFADGREGDDLILVAANDDGFAQLGYASGGAGVDTLGVAATALTSEVDLTGSLIDTIEIVALDGRASASGLEARFLSSAFETGLLGTNTIIRGAGAGSSETLVVEVADGRAILSHLRFENWDGTGAHADHVRIEGSDAADTISGTVVNDLIRGGGGADLMLGGLGDDVFEVGSVGDRTIEAAGAGDDTVVASIGWRLAANIENLTLDQSAGAAAGIGNDLANTLTGNGFANTLNGLGGADVLRGLGGDDRYIVDDAGDRVTETAAGGHDVVYALTDYRLRDLNVEELRVHPGADAEKITLIGNAQANLIVGGAGANALSGYGGGDVLKGLAGDDVLNGGAGADTLTGGAGRDAFVFASPLGEIDRVMDFSHADDTLRLDDAIFTAFTRGQPTAAEVADHLVYDDRTGFLAYDADGVSGAGEAVAFAKLSAGLGGVLDHTDFLIV